jgi:phosphoserine phosphatase RsbU/P
MGRFKTFSAIRARGMLILHPNTRLGRLTLWFGGGSGLLIALCLLTGSAFGSKVYGWAIFLTLVFTACVLLLIFGWARRVVMWRLRNRLIVTYIFIGVIPIALLLLMAAIGSYLLAGQFSTYVVISQLQSTLSRLEAVNGALAAQLNTLEIGGNLNAQNAGQLAAVTNEILPSRTVTVVRGKSSFTLSGEGILSATRRDNVADLVKGDFSGFVMDRDSLHLLAVKRYAQRLTVISDIPITAELIRPAASQVGAVTLLLPDRGGDVQVPPPAQASPNARRSVHAGNLPQSSSSLDPTFSFFTLFGVVDGETGQPKTGAVVVITRASLLYTALFSTLGDETKILQAALLGLVIFFGLIEFAALYTGIRLSRGVTRSVADIYSATEHVERGDLAHRIDVRGHDQMAVLEQSFNSMTESLGNLLEEQKEKQRLESELAIGHEVQESLFPQKFTGLPSLEVFGVCRPARSVSGDYYDFIQLGTDRLVLAVGDISGKGISAALLMATVHAFIRAYSLEPEKVITDEVIPPVLGVGPFSQGNPHMYYRGDGTNQSRLAPGRLMTTLNYQLFRSTPPEKYATMFLGCYDATARELRYCNAGHLQPVLARADGTVVRLETSGTVVGLFDGATYEESVVAMQPGDLLAAFSDGVTEPEKELIEFGEERLIELILENRHQQLRQIGEVVTSAVALWIGTAEQPDDVTIVLARAC